MSLTNEQVDALLAPLDPRRVKQANGQSHLEAWDVRRHLIRVFGYGGWSFRVKHVECILERSIWEEKVTHKGRHSVVYRVIGALDIYDNEGGILCTFEDGATGDALNQPSFGDAHDMALKTAMSQALKRCAVNLGDRFGLSLYNKGATGAVVGKTLAHASTVEHEAAEEVTGGELDEQRHGKDATQQGAGVDGSASGGDAAMSGDGANSHDVGRSEPEPAPTLATFDDHKVIRREVAGLDDAETTRFKAWWKQQSLPSIKDKDVLTAGQAELILSFLDELHDQRERVSNDPNDLAARAQALADKAKAPKGKDAAMAAAGEGRE